MNSKTITKKAGAVFAAVALAANMTPMAAFADNVEYSGDGSAQTTLNLSVPRDRIATNNDQNIDLEGNLTVLVPSVINMALSDGNNFISPTAGIENKSETLAADISAVTTSEATINGITARPVYYNEETKTLHYEQGGEQIADKDAQDRYGYAIKLTREYMAPQYDETNPEQITGYTNERSSISIDAQQAINTYTIGAEHFTEKTSPAYLGTTEDTNNGTTVNIEGKANDVFKNSIGKGNTATIGTIEWNINPSIHAY